ncbi:MAG: hypothetical protein K9M82_11600 [Deltaproteobacteria bacterium]|nr:hypothetical protein [Deltaproteobacteria bacterium]
MKNWRKPSCVMVLAVLFVSLLVAVPGAFAETKRIRNHSFGIFQSRRGDVFLHIRNDDCQAEYRAVVNETVLGEGTIEVDVTETVIPFGDADLYIRCSGGEMYADLR